MCGRYAASRRAEDLVVEFEAVRAEGQAGLPADYNVAPTKDVYVVRHKRERDAEGLPTGGGHRELRAVRWGLVPSWAKDVSVGNRMLNARVESLTDKPAFKKAAASRRCLVPADGWYEWAKRLDSPGKQPYYVTPQDGSVLAFAGLWEVWGRGDDRLYTCTIVTSPAVAALTEIHERMPLVLPPDRWTAWLDPARDDVEELAHPTPPEVVEALEIRPVSTAVNNVANNGPGLVARAEGVSAPARPAGPLLTVTTTTERAGERPATGEPLPGWVAATVTFLCSGAVLVLEIVGLRLIAPYVGVTLQTSTAIIGFALAAIAVGAWTGGATADRTDPRRLLAPLMVAGGALVVAVLPLVRFTGSLLTGADAGGVLLLAAVAVVVPAALLSAVPPMVVKLQLSSLSETGAVVGRLSGIGTLGGIAATFVTGFLLIAILPSSVILVGTGGLTVVAGIAVGVLLRRRTAGGAGRVPVGLLVLAVAGAGLAAVAPTPCEEETAYHCARVVADPERDSGRVLLLDTLRHSYVDVDDPTYLEFEYVRAVAAVTDVIAPAGEALSALHIGGGGLTVPRYLDEVRPGTESLVIEVDPGVVAIDRDQLELQTSDRMRVLVADGRVGLAEEARGQRDLIVGDAFGGLSVPWQLTTREAMELVDTALADDGVYVVNLIDHPPLNFVRAELATMRSVFPHVALLARAPALAGEDGGNLVAVASRQPLPTEEIAAALPDRDLAWQVAEGSQLDEFVGDAAVLTDDHAPVDQLLTPYG